MLSAEVFFLVGPTASGKTAVAQRLAEREGLEILSADSMLVYRGMDIGTAKPPADDRRRVRYWGVDVAAPAEEFNVAAYIRLAREALRTCAAAGRRMIVVGGTGLYIKCLTEGLAALPKTSRESRQRWQQVLKEEGVAGLQAALRARNPGWLEALPDKQNSRRLIRALELADAGCVTPPSTWRKQAAGPTMIGLAWPREQLYARIQARVEQMYHGGLIEETRRLMAVGFEAAPTAGQAIGYAEAIAHLRGLCTLEEAVQRTLIRTRQLAKRQLTWFRRQANVNWIELEQTLSIPKIAEIVWAEWMRMGPARMAV